jgi:hypothetical protein
MPDWNQRYAPFQPTERIKDNVAPDPDHRSASDVLGTMGSHTPKGAKLLRDVFANENVQGVINNMVLKPRLPEAGEGFNNPYDAYAANGFLQQLGREVQDRSNIPRRQDILSKMNKVTDSNYDEDLSETDNPYNGGSGQQPADNLNESLKSMLGEGGDTNVSNINNSFTAIPRLMGILGQYVTPPSKITLADMYEATLDSTLGSIMQTAKSMIINQLGEYHHPNPRVQKLMDETFENIKKNQFHYRALDFLIAGFSVGEVMWGVNEDYYNIITRVTWAPYTNIEFMINDYGEMQAALQPNLVASQDGLFEPAGMENNEALFAVRQLIPQVLPYVMVERHNLFYCGYDATFNPYGVSPVRRAYKYYMMKNLALEMFMTALARNGVPTLAVYYNKDMIKDEEQKRMFEESIDSLTVGGTLYIPGTKGEGFEVDSISLDSSGLSVFLDFANYCDKMMARSMGFPQEILLGEGNSYSSGTIQKETYEDMLKLYRDWYERAYMKQIVEPTLRLNFSDYELRNTYGEFVTELRESDRLEKMQQWSEAVSSGLVNPSNLHDVNKFREACGLHPYESEEELAAKDPTNFMDNSKPNERDVNRPYSHGSGDRAKSGV